MIDTPNPRLGIGLANDAHPSWEADVPGTVQAVARVEARSSTQGLHDWLVRPDYPFARPSNAFRPSFAVAPLYQSSSALPAQATDSDVAIKTPNISPSTASSATIQTPPPEALTRWILGDQALDGNSSMECAAVDSALDMDDGYQDEEVASSDWFRGEEGF